MQKVTLQISGMSCGHCLKSVSAALHGAAGIEEVRSVEMGRAELAIDQAVTTAEAVAAVVTAAGYPATAVVQA